MKKTIAAIIISIAMVSVGWADCNPQIKPYPKKFEAVNMHSGSMNKNIKYVKNGTTIQASIDAITDESATNQYVVIIPPGTYTETVTVPRYIHLDGISKEGTIITNNSFYVVTVDSFASLRNLTVTTTGTGYAVKLVEDSGTIRDGTHLTNINIFASALASASGIELWTVETDWVYNLLQNVYIEATEYGIHKKFSGNFTMSNVEIKLVGTASGNDHVGLYFDANSTSSRVKWYGGGVMSSWTDDKITGAGDNVYGIHLPSASNEGRIHLYNLDIMVRNEDNAAVNALRMESTNANGRIRVFGGRYQAEAPTGTDYVFYQDGSGNIETYGPYARAYNATQHIYGTVYGWHFDDLSSQNRAYFSGGFAVGGGTEDTNSTLTLEVNGNSRTFVDSQTIADNTVGASPATLTLSPTTSNVEITCNDADGCDITMSEGGVYQGQVIEVTNVSANVVNFADTAGVSELAGAFAAGQYDSISMRYLSDRWKEVGRSDN